MDRQNLASSSAPRGGATVHPPPQHDAWINTYRNLHPQWQSLLPPPQQVLSPPIHFMPQFFIMTLEITDFQLGQRLFEIYIYFGIRTCSIKLVDFEKFPFVSPYLFHFIMYICSLLQYFPQKHCLSYWTYSEEAL